MEKFREWRREHAPETFQGIQVENDRLLNPIHWTTVAAIRSWERKIGTEVIVHRGIFEEGAKLIISTHPRRRSVLDLPWAIAEATGRLPVMTPKRSLVEPTYQESEEILEETGKTGDIFSGRGNMTDEALLDRAQGVVFQGFRHMSSWVITSTLDTIPVDRRAIQKATMKGIKQALHDGRIVGTFLQWTRTDENSLENCVPFAAAIMRSNRNVPAHIMVQQSSGTGMEDPLELEYPRIYISEPFCLDLKMKSLPEIHEMILGRTVDLMHRAGIEEIRYPEAS